MRILLDSEAAELVANKDGKTLREVLTKRGNTIIEMDLFTLDGEPVDAIIGSNCFRINETNVTKVEALLKGLAQEASRKESQSD